MPALASTEMVSIPIIFARWFTANGNIHREVSWNSAIAIVGICIGVIMTCMFFFCIVYPHLAAGLCSWLCHWRCPKIFKRTNGVRNNNANDNRPSEGFELSSRLETGMLPPAPTAIVTAQEGHGRVGVGGSAFRPSFPGTFPRTIE